MAKKEKQAGDCRLETGGCLKPPASSLRPKAYHKYHANPTIRDGIRFASKAEADWCSIRLFELKVGQLREVRLQPRYQLGDILYIADLEVTHLDGTTYAEDVKGVETPRFRLVKKLWAKYGPCKLQIVKRKGRRWSIEQLNGAPGGTMLETGGQRPEAGD